MPRCESCIETSWKLRGGGGNDNDPIDPKELFDLATNPEEDEANNCLDESEQTGSPLEDVALELTDRLDRWWDCVSDDDPVAEADDCEEWPPPTTTMP